MAAAHGHVIIIKRSGKDGSRFPVTGDCKIGSGLHCEIRIHLDDVAEEHCSIQCQEEGKCALTNLSTQIPTKLNDVDVTGVAMLCHGDIIGVSDRLFRWEYEAIPKVSSIMKPTVPLLPRKSTDDMVPSKRLVAVVSPQIREKHDTSQSLRTWVLRRSLGNSLSTRSRQPTGTPEERRRTSVIKTPAQDSDWSAVQDNRTPHSVKISRRTSVKSSIKKSLLKVTPHQRKSVSVSTVTPIACEMPQTVKSVHGSVSDMVETPLSVTPRSRKSKLTLMAKRSLGVVSPKAEETSRTVTPQRRSYRKESLGDDSSIKSVKGTPYVKKMFFGEQTPDSSEAQSLHGKKSQSYDRKTPVADTMVTVLQSPDLFSSDKVPSGEIVTAKELKESSTPISAKRPKRKSAGLLLAHFRENQELFSRRRRNSTPSANTDKIITRAIKNSEKISTRSGRASMVVSKKSKLSFTPSSQSKTPRKLKSLRAMSAKAAKRRLTDVDLSEIAADKLKAESPKTPDKKKMAALLQCHKPRLLFSEVVKKTPVRKTPVKKTFVKLPSVPIGRRRKIQKKSKVHTPRKAPVKGMNSTGHIDSPETIIIHGKQSMALKRSIQRIREDIESQKVASTLVNFQPTKDIKTSVSAPESSREVNTRKSVSFSPAPQVVAFAASRRISTRKSLKIPNISEELGDTLSPSNELSLFETKPKRKTSILKKTSSIESHVELMETGDNSSAVINPASVNTLGSVVLSTPVRVSERQKGRTSSQSPSSPKKTVTMRKSSSASVTHQSPEALNTSIVSQASTTFDFDAVTTPCISVEKLVSPLNTTSSKKQINDSSRRHTSLSAQQIFKELVADKVIDSSKWQYNDVSAATSATAASQWTGSESSAMSSGKKTNRRSVSFPVNRNFIRKSRDKRSSGEVYASSKKTFPVASQQKVAPELHKNNVSVNTSEESFFSKEACAYVVNELEQLSATSLELSGLSRNSARVSRKSQQLMSVDLIEVKDAKKDLRSSKKSLLNEASHSKGNDKQRSLSIRQRKSTPNDLTDVRGVRRLFDVTSKQGSPMNDLTDVRGVKQLLKTPKLQKSPRNDLTDVKGVKQLLKTPRAQKSPKNDLTDVRGVRRLLRSPLQQQKSPQNDLTDVRGVKQLLEPPQRQKSPRNDLTDVRGVKQILRSPQHQNSPANDLTDVGGVKELFRSTRKRASPENDLRDVKGVKRLLRSPIQQKSPYNDLRDVRGVKKLFRSSEKYKSPKNDLSDVTGVSSLFTSPQQEVLSIKRKLAVREEFSSLTKTQASGAQENETPTAEQDDTGPLNAKRRKYNIEEEETNNSGEIVGVVNKFSTRGKRNKKDISNHPDGVDLCSTGKSKAVKDNLSLKNATLSASSDLEPELHKNTSPPRTRRGKVQVTATTPLAVSTDSTTSPRNLRGKTITTKDLQDTVSLPTTRRGRKQIIMKEKVDEKSQQLADLLQEPKQDGLLKPNQLDSSDTISSNLEPESHKHTSPPRTRRGKVQVTAASPLAVSTESTSSPRNLRGKTVTTKDLQDTVSLPASFQQVAVISHQPPLS